MKIKLEKPDASDVLFGVKKSAGMAYTAFSVAVRVLITIVLVFLTTAAMTAVVMVIFLTKFLTVDMDVKLEMFELNQTSIVYYSDRSTGETHEFQTLHGAQNRIMASYDEIPKRMTDALVAIEDKRFWEHKGVDWKRTISAATELVGGTGSFGGSSITQQLIKNLTGDKEVTIERKVTEIFRALAFEKEYTKQQILEGYFNTSYFGEGCYGVKTAAQVYFGKELDELTIAECACIIGITNSPTAYDPYLNPEKSLKRRGTILSEMYKQGKISAAEYNAAKDEPLNLVRVSAEDEESTLDIWPRFIDQVFNDAVNDLVNIKGVPNKAQAQNMLYSGGYRVYSTCDIRYQNMVDDIYGDNDNFPAVKDSEKPQSAIILLDPYTGDILAMQQRGDKTGNRQRVIPCESRRQPGSSIKPITVYGAAMDAGLLTPYSVVDDMPSYASANNEPRPRNDNRRYRGRTTVITAVQNSVNAVAVRVVSAISPQASFDFGKRLGLVSLVERREVTRASGTQIYSDVDVAPLAMGGLTDGLTLRELTSAYAAFPNKGVYNGSRTYTHITDADGNMVLDNRSGGTVVMKEKTAYYMTTVLQQVVAAGTGSKAKLDDMPAAGKTGTTSNDYDRWFVGYTPYFTAGSWFGFDIPKKIKLEQSTNPALVMWRQVMEKVHEDLERREFWEPDGLVSAAYCLDGGGVPTDACRLDPRGSRVGTGKYYREDVPKSPCEVHVTVPYDSVTKALATPFCPEENLINVGLMNLDRGLLWPNVTVEDEGYTVRHWSPSAGVYFTPPEEGLFRPLFLSDAGYNQRFCTVHTQAPEVTPEPEPPEETGGGEEPEPPEIPRGEG